MNFGLLLCFVLALCLVEATSIRQKIVLSAKQKQKDNNLDDEISSILNEDISQYSMLESNSKPIFGALHEPRFLHKRQVDATLATTPINTAASNVAVPTLDDITTNTVPAAIASSNPIFVSGNPASSPQLTAIPSIVNTQTMASTEEEDPEMSKLSAALEAVKEDIVGNSKQIGDEKKWVSAVKAITDSYDDKTKRVNEHITVLRKEQKKLFDKKKQIENLKLQKRLQSKLTLASDELTTLQNSLEHVQEKSHELTQEHSSLETTIKKIEAQLTKLKGPNDHEKEKGKDHEGAAAAGSEEGGHESEAAGAGHEGGGGAGHEGGAEAAEGSHSAPEKDGDHV